MTKLQRQCLKVARWWAGGYGDKGFSYLGEISDSARRIEEFADVSVAYYGLNSRNRIKNDLLASAIMSEAFRKESEVWW